MSVDVFESRLVLLGVDAAVVEVDADLVIKFRIEGSLHASVPLRLGWLVVVWVVGLLCC